MSSFEAESQTLAGARFVPDPAPPGARSARFRATDPGALDAEKCPASSPEELVRRAYEKGLAEGRGALPWQEAEALRSATASLEHASEALGALRRAYLLANRRAVLELALAVAARILARELRTDEQALGELVGRAVERLQPDGPVHVKVAPQDLETLERGLESELSALTRAHDVQLIAEPSLSPGDVRVSGGSGEVDARLASVLERVREELDEAIGAPEPEATP